MLSAEVKIVQEVCQPKGVKAMEKERNKSRKEEFGNTSADQKRRKMVVVDFL